MTVLESTIYSRCSVFIISSKVSRIVMYENFCKLSTFPKFWINKGILFYSMMKKRYLL